MNHCSRAKLVAVDGKGDDLNPTQWAGAIAFLVLMTVPLAVALAAWCKRRYAAAVTALQRGATPTPAPIPDVPRVPPTAPAVPLEIEVRDVAAPGAAPPDALRAGVQLRRRVLATQFVLATGYWWTLLLAIVLALAVLAQATGNPIDSDGDEASGWGHLVVWPVLLLPPLLAWAFQAGLREVRVWAGYALALAAVLAGTLVLGAGRDAALFVAGAGLLGLMLVAFMRPAVRGAGPPLVLAIIGALLVLFALGTILAAFDDSPDDAPITTEDWLLFAAALVPLLAASAWAGWRLLMRMARRYAAKRYSELQLAHDAYWSLITAFALGFVLLISFEDRTQRSMEWLALAVALAWLGWRLAQRLGLRWATRRAPATGPALLLLRVFKPSGRSESFADRLLARWRFVGPVWLIAGPDLAGAFMEPDEFFAWLRRRLRERFVAEPAQVEERVAALDNRRDPDGRFRTSELFCADSTWRDVVLALIARADVVLLDLREFTPQRAGTHFELVQLLRRAPLRKVLVLVDARDELTPLEAAVQQAWAEAQRPLATGDAPPTLRLLRIAAGSGAELRGLAQAAAQAAMSAT